MFRLRRYRVFIVFAVITLGLLYHFNSIQNQDGVGAATIEQLKDSKLSTDSPPTASDDKSSKGDEAQELAEVTLPAVPARIESGHHDAEPEPSAPAERSSSFTPEKTSAGTGDFRSKTRSASEVEVTADDINPVGHPKPELQTKITKAFATSLANEHVDVESALQEDEESTSTASKPTTSSKIHWKQQSEHFPIPTSMIIPLPTGKTKAIPKIQHDFEPESATEKSSREEKLERITDMFSHSWSGYHSQAWLHDELSPRSGAHRDPFCGWGATLVDTLDTLWIMNLKEEFEEAVEAVKEIDFTTATRNDIPLFETVIRYLGGLLGAYDVSGGAYRVLLDKAVELAEILMGAFDTPNRMPMTYYLWKPTFASQPHRARTRVVLAELGSLSVEFTRLAQITKEPKYYDAVARITNELELMQSRTKLPGLWPDSIDASGCKKQDRSMTLPPMPGEVNAEKPLGVGYAKPPGADDSFISKETLPEPTKSVREKSKPGEHSLVRQDKSIESTLHYGSSVTSPVLASTVVESEKATATARDRDQLRKRDLATPEGTEASQASPPKKPDCEPQGLASPPFSYSESFGIGGRADSTYEYLPKEYLLLGGLEGKYQSMYELAADAIIEGLLFRPMLPDESRNILGAGIYRASESDETIDKHSSRFLAEGSHLTCFAGGMFAIGSKIFQRQDDLDRAKKLTDGCIWAYESTNTGIMPETFVMVPCADIRNCPWNETLWREELDPHWESRENARLQQQLVKENAAKENAAKEVLEPDTLVVTSTASIDGDVKATPIPSLPAKGDKLVSSSERIESKRPSSTVNDKIMTATKRSSSGQATGSNEASPRFVQKRQLDDLSGADGGPVVSHKEALTTEGPQKSKSIAATASMTAMTYSKSETALATASAPTVEELSAAEYTDVPSLESESTSVYEPPLIPTRDEFIANRIKNERLPIGMSRINDRKYILRPEAIESVFIMYRITGDEYWRKKGWQMFQAVEKHTNTEYGASAINDVTAEEPFKLDEMESFWLAETLKYYYLLFSDPSHVSLDEYILNTEAHPFKRPLA